MTIYTLQLPWYRGKVRLTFEEYHRDKSLVMQFTCARTGEPIATPTVCVPGSNLEPLEVCIKSWSENEGMMEELQRLGIIGPLKRLVATGWVMASVHDLLVSKEN